MVRQRVRLRNAERQPAALVAPAGRDRAYVPDLVVVSPDRLPAVDDRDAPYLRAAPDLAIEILSPKQPLRPCLDQIVFHLPYGVRPVSYTPLPLPTTPSL